MGVMHNSLLYIFYSAIRGISFLSLSLNRLYLIAIPQSANIVIPRSAANLILYSSLGRPFSILVVVPRSANLVVRRVMYIESLARARLCEQFYEIDLGCVRL